MEEQDFDMYWSEFYPNAIEDIPSPRPCVPDDDPTNTSGLPKVQLSAYVDADHAHDQATRRSVTGIIIFINQTPIRFLSKRQTVCQTATYSSEMVAACSATDLLIEY